MRKKPDVEKSRAIAISGLTFIASDDEEMGRFLNLTGLAAEDLREAAANPGFMVGVLDFFLGFEPTLLRFAEAQNINPQDIVDARQVLAGPEEAW